MRDIVQQLAKAMRGRVAGSGDSDYMNCIRIDNGRINRQPAAVALPSDAEDVAAAIRFARDEGLKLTVRSGGHSAAGYSLNDGGIVLDIRGLSGLSLDPNTNVLTVGMGSIWRDVYNFLRVSRTGLVPIAGGCLGVGAGGFLLGGGYSFVSRSYGLGIDNIEALTIVLADGSVRRVARASTGQDADLFWAACGGGGGNFGVAIDVDIKTHHLAAPTVLAGQVLFPFYRIDEILPVYNELAKTCPASLAIYGFLGYQPDPRNGGAPALFLRFTPIFNGRFDDGMKALEPLFKLGPSNVSLYSMTLPEFELMAGGSTSVSGRAAYIRSALLPPGGMTQELAKIFKYHMSRMPGSDSFVVWTHAGGRIAEIAPGASAYWHRKSLFMPEVKAIWDANRPQDARQVIEWAYSFFEDVAMHADGAYLNYIDPLQRDWKSKYYGGNLDRLVGVKSRVDPDDVFSFQQGLTSDFEPDGVRPLNLDPLGVT
ncbi:FAD-binding oxidoreductase [Mesorhizobium sp. M4B.F.Ca.ET.017.02.2.1]|uniref:FAD-binding oxidoreductase n=1 Tax=Mesorhizobium sp. M4B.F.Ca.ET.017.02.2.1 TaxID=2496649 RepID=UPI000FCC64A5|nr:FAD-binding oxidoreductase [Mesorhizobium sp. M4B.F.Ca.ET.017.02.2.1]RVD31778.1 FAD-binding oxidoreductase [Mesorhizobium sp. M4B.F.Ca.ET.017.02.2.1]